MWPDFIEQEVWEVSEAVIWPLLHWPHSEFNISFCINWNESSRGDFFTAGFLWWLSESLCLVHVIWKLHFFWIWLKEQEDHHYKILGDIYSLLYYYSFSKYFFSCSKWNDSPFCKKMGGRHIRERKSMKDRNDALIIYESRGETTGGKKERRIVWGTEGLGERAG